jgi:ParB family transcriptional regulator, chromosome partitioning protein
LCQTGRYESEIANKLCNGFIGSSKGTVLAETIKLLSPQEIERNPENPRLIFHQDELDALQESIGKQGILVPLTVYRDGKQYFLLDGERRWRCSLKLGLATVPAIIQPKPDKMTNLMMMFAIHHRRNDWDPLPTALKLRELERLFTKRQGRKPTESELSELASLRRGEVRRLKKLLALPEEYRDELLRELEKPRSKQVITVDHVLEATNAAAALRKRGIIGSAVEDRLRRAVIAKFRTKVIANTVAPRKLARIARAVGRNEVSMSAAKRIVDRLIKDPAYSIESAFAASVEQADFEHSLEQLAQRTATKLEEHMRRKYAASEGLLGALQKLRATIAKALKA